MKIHTFLPTLFSIAAAVITTSCSTQQSPVSISSPEVEKVGAITDVQLQTIACAKPDEIWGLSWERVANTNNFYIYKYIENGSYWVNSGHYGTDLAISYSGKCYHINTAQEIWWGTLHENGNIPIPPGQESIEQVAAGYHRATNGSFIDYVWVIARKDNMQRIFVYDPETRDPSSKWWNVTDPDFDGKAIQSIQVDPQDGDYAVVVVDNKLYFKRDRYSEWDPVVQAPASVKDASVCNGKIAAYSSDYGIYKVMDDGSHFVANGMGSTVSNTLTTLYYLDLKYRMKTVPY